MDFSTKLQGKNRQLKKHENINMDDFRLDWEKAKLSDIPSTHHPDSLVERYNIALRLVLKHNSFKQRKWYRKTEKKTGYDKELHAPIQVRHRYERAHHKHPNQAQYNPLNKPFIA